MILFKWFILDLDVDTDRGIPHLFIASGPWISETSSMGPSATNTRAISKDPVDFTQIKIYYPGKEKAPRSNPFDGENRYGIYI